MRPTHARTPKPLPVRPPLRTLLASRKKLTLLATALLLAGTGLLGTAQYQGRASAADAEAASGAGAGVGTGAGTAHAATPSASRQDVVSYLQSISGSHTITGQHNKEPLSQPTQYTDKAHDITGVYPGLWGGEFGFGQSDIDSRQTMIDEAEKEWKKGSLTNLTWHVCPPTRGSSCGWDAGTGIQDDLSDDQWKQLITDGTDLNKAWKKRLDEIAPYLQQLKDAGVPALFRPLHEMNDSWCWWCGRPGADGSRKLYQITHDYLVKEKGLTNLVWVWNVDDKTDGSEIPDYYPGDDYADVVSIDAWSDAGYPSQNQYDNLRKLAGEKPMALAEVGRVPSPSDLAAEPDWAYFMTWSEMLTDPAYNSPDKIRQTYGDDRSLNQGELKIGSSAATRHSAG